MKNFYSNLSRCFDLSRYVFYFYSCLVEDSLSSDYMALANKFYGENILFSQVHTTHEFPDLRLTTYHQSSSLQFRFSYFRLIWG